MGGRIKDGKWMLLPKSCSGFTTPLFNIMEWDDSCRYRLRGGQYSEDDYGQIMGFDLSQPEVL